MAFTELALLSLAWNLAVNPTDADIQKYQSLNQEDQVKIQMLIDQQDTLPSEIEKLKEQGKTEEKDGVNHAPTFETTR